MDTPVRTPTACDDIEDSFELCHARIHQREANGESTETEQRQEEHHQLPPIENVPTDGWTAQAQVEYWLVGGEECRGLDGQLGIGAADVECTTDLEIHATHHREAGETPWLRVL